MSRLFRVGRPDPGGFLGAFAAISRPRRRRRERLLGFRSGVFRNSGASMRPAAISSRLKISKDRLTRCSP
jgi:hypothetical protein